MTTTREYFYAGEILTGYIVTRYVESADYRCVETHSYCPYRNKSGKIEHSTFTSKWENNRGQFETFRWNVEKNEVETVDSPIRLYLNGTKFQTNEEYQEALKNA